MQAQRRQHLRHPAQVALTFEKVVCLGGVNHNIIPQATVDRRIDDGRVTHGDSQRKPGFLGHRQRFAEAPIGKGKLACQLGIITAGNYKFYPGLRMVEVPRQLLAARNVFANDERIAQQRMGIGENPQGLELQQAIVTPFSPLQHQLRVRCCLSRIFLDEAFDFNRVTGHGCRMQWRT